MLKVFFDTDNIGMITDMLDAEEHSHYPIQLFLSIDEPLKITIAGKEVCAQCISVGQNVPHAFSSQNRAHISAIIETASDFSRSLNERIDGAFAVFENAGLSALQSKAKELIAASDKEQWQAFMRDFKLYLGIEPREQPLDERITELLSLLKQCDCYDHTIAAFAKKSIAIAQPIVPPLSGTDRRSAEKLYCIAPNGKSVCRPARRGKHNRRSHACWL